MKRTKILFSLCAIVLLLAALFTCTENPAEPQNDNPFDTGNTTTGGDPFHLTATIAGGGVTLNWNRPQAEGLAGFKVYRSEQKSSGYTSLQEVGANTTQYVDQTAENGHSYWYRVTARNGSGRETAMTNTAAVNIKTDPVLVINGGDTYTLTRQVSLTILANTAQQMMLASSADFNGAQWEPYTTGKSWTLETGEGAKTVYMRVKYDNGNEYPVISATILPQPMNPAIVIIADTVEYTASQTVSLTVNADGALQMKISENASFTGINWQPFSQLSNFTLSTGEGGKTVYARFKNDFEIVSNAVSDSITLDTTPPTPVLVISPDSGITSETNFQFDPTSSYDNIFPADQLQARFDWENDGVWDTNWQPLQVASHTYAVGGGDKTVRMELQDGTGWTADTTTQIFVNSRPVAQFTFTNDTSNFRKIHFDASASSDYEDGSNLQYRWDWENDGMWDTGFLTADTISHEYGSGGDFTVTLQVRDRGALAANMTNSVSIINLEFVLVPAGPYTYGDPPQTLGIDYDYSIMKYEVTNAQYVTYLEEALSAREITVTGSSVQGYYSGDQYWSPGNYEFYNLDDPDARIHWNGVSFTIDSGYENHPVLEVTWFGANGMAEYYGLQLPSEQEWEKAARGNTGWDYPWGNSIDGSRANYRDSGDPFDNSTTPVGYYDGSNYGGFQTTDSPSPYGAYDMAGNVWEWCDSFYGGSYPNSRVFRGGSWGGYTYYLTSWYRNSYNPSRSSVIIGFRLLSTF